MARAARVIGRGGARRLLAVLGVAVAGTLAGLVMTADAAEARPIHATTSTARPRGAPAAAPRRAETGPAPRGARMASAARRPARRPPTPQARQATTEQTVIAALTRAGARTRTEPALLAAMAARESRLDPRARNRQSTASGLMQFTEATWLEAVRDHGAAHGLAREAATLRTDPQTGVISTRTPRDRAYLLNLRFNPRLAAALAGERSAAAGHSLRADLGRAPSAADLYAVHLLGPAGGRRFLTALAETPTRPAVEVVGSEALARNRNVFVARDGRAFTLQDVHDAFARDAEAGAALLARTQVAAQ